MPNSQPQPPRRPTERDETLATTNRERERGLWNYLVWSFFIAQIIGKGDLLGGPAKAGDDVDLNADNIHDHAAQQAASLQALAGVAGTENGTTPPINTVLDAKASLAATDGGEFGHSTDDVAIQLAELARGEEAVVVDGAQTVAQGSPADPGSPPEAGPGGGDGAGGGIGIDVGVDIGQLPGAIGGLLDPVLDTVGNVLPPVVGLVDDLLGTVGDTTAPVFALVDDFLGTVGDVVPTLFALADDVVSTVGNVAAPVLTLVESLPDIIDVAAEGPLQIVLATTTQVLDTLDSTVGTTLPTVVAGLTTALETTSNLLTEPTGSLQDLLSLGTDAAAPVGDAVASAGSIPFNVLASLSGIVVDDLFNGGQYTEYNLSLQTDPTVPAMPSTDVAGAGSSVASLLDHLIGDAQSNGDTHHAGAGVHVGFGLPSALDDILFRGNDLAA